MSTEGLTHHSGLVTSLSWIPTEAIQGSQRLAFDSGITHYDPPPPTEGMDVERLREMAGPRWGQPVIDRAFSPGIPELG